MKACKNLQNKRATINEAVSKPRAASLTVKIALGNETARQIEIVRI